jgi:DNA-binding GntR family transcriptional regulator
LREIAAKYGLDNDAVLKLFTEFQSLGLITLSGNFAAVLQSPNAKEMHEAYEIRAGIEEIAGRTAAEALKGNTAELQKGLDAMRVALRTGDLDGCAEHDVKFHKAILQSSGNRTLLRVWEALVVDVRIRISIGKVSKDLAEVVESHQPIVDALRNVEQGKPACCCATTWRLSPSTSRNQIPTRAFTERSARIWRARKTFSKPFSRLRAFRFPVCLVKLFISQLAESGVTITTFSLFLAGVGV